MAGLAYKVADETVNTTLTYTVPSPTNGVGTITFQAIGGDLQIHDDSDFNNDYFTLQENNKITFNMRYLEGKPFYFKSTTSVTLQVLYFEGLLT